jgi:hypothetical protein
MTSFVECAIYNENGAITVYHLLIFNARDRVSTNVVKPIAATVLPVATTACWFGTSGNSLTFTGGSAGVRERLGSIYLWLVSSKSCVYIMLTNKLTVKGSRLVVETFS